MIKSLFAAGLLCALATAATAQVQVRGYTRSDGTYVAPHTRSSPNNTTADNYSSYRAPAPSYRAPSYTTPQPLYGSSSTNTCEGYGCYGQPSTANGQPRTETVNGYVRRDGTYVAQYVRSRPQ